MMVCMTIDPIEMAVMCQRRETAGEESNSVIRNRGGAGSVKAA
jgi:hypothetical protein